MVPGWAETVAWISLGIAFFSSIVILLDELVLGHRQQMSVMNLVHPITALYWGPVWLWAYLARGRMSSKKVMQRRAVQLAQDGVDGEWLEQAGESTDPEDMRPWHIADAVSHCGAGCTLGDIAGEWIVFALGPLVIAASGTLGPELIFDFFLAWSLGVLFQYFTIVPMRDDVSGVRGVWLAMRADTLSILSFQLGLFGWMALSHFVVWPSPPPIDSSVHWWMMQLGMVVGFFTAWPVNRWLVVKGWKEKMDHRKHLGMMVSRTERAAA